MADEGVAGACKFKKVRWNRVHGTQTNQSNSHKTCEPKSPGCCRIATEHIRTHTHANERCVDCNNAQTVRTWHRGNGMLTLSATGCTETPRLNKNFWNKSVPTRPLVSQLRTRRNSSCECTVPNSARHTSAGGPTLPEKTPTCQYRSPCVGRQHLHHRGGHPAAGGLRGGWLHAAYSTRQR